MKVGIISDSHDNIWVLDKALKQIKEKGAEILIHCGDFCAPFIMNNLSSVDIPVHCVFGNIDDRHITPKMAESKTNITFHGDIGEFEIDGKKIAITHFPHFAEGLAAKQQYDLVCHGHTHDQRKEKIGKTLLLNPGEIMGRKGTPSYAIYDTETSDAEFYEVK